MRFELETLRVDRDATTVKIIVDRPERLNALSSAVLGELEQLLGLLGDEPVGSVRGLLLTGAGDRAFVAGADIAEMRGLSPDQGAELGRLGQRVTELLEALPFPTIACVNGYALGGGCELAMACDYILATRTAVFGQPEVNLGLIPGFGGCVRLLTRVGPARARELIFTGRHVRADEAERIGLVARVFESRDAMMRGAEESLALAASRSPAAIALCKEILTSLDGRTMRERLEIENLGFRRAFESDEMREGTAAFLEKRRPAFATPG